MQIIDYTDFLKGTFFNSGSAMTVGVFDGVHRGHQLLLQRVIDAGLPHPTPYTPYHTPQPPLIPVVVTFKENPHKFFKGKKFVDEIYPLDEKLKIFERFDIAAVILIDFSADFRQIKGIDFINSLISCGNMRLLVVGRDFRCGFNGETTALDIKRWCGSGLEGSGHQLQTDIVEPLLEGGAPVSSSRIRAAIAAGDQKTASMLLGRNYGGY